MNRAGRREAAQIGVRSFEASPVGNLSTLHNLVISKYIQRKSMNNRANFANNVGMVYKRQRFRQAVTGVVKEFNNI
jgi:hypothetical protein